MLTRLFRKPALGSEVPTPPRKRIEEVGGGDYAAIGKEFFGYFTSLSHLQPDERVLDVGCGCGRMAVPLTKHLNAQGSYEGFDIQPAAIRWCQKNITTRFPAFGFTLADVRSIRYNPNGGSTSSDYRFPYDDATFDYVFLTSVFTHMLKKDMEHYLDEIVRVTKPGGRCLITYFLLSDESRGLIDAGRSTLTFPETVEETAVSSAKVPEGAVAFPEDYVREVFASRGMTIDDPVRYGSWCGRDSYLSYQDIVLARR